ncbi:alpha-2-macroglobulin family protein [Luteolibacter sp. AS25]|uniref:alpha-2-macroglobulin family protein n=1 Tax=Luteolibacter sp. AS25 TaxID=3135776 RepID=UPI00398AA6F1
MKIISRLATLLFVLSGVVEATPRLIVSTASLVPESEIDVVFDHPMVGDDLLGKVVENDLVDVQPALPAKLFWKLPTVAELKLDGIPAIGTKYEFSVRSGAGYLDGSEVEIGKFASVSTEGFRLMNARIPNRWSSDYSPVTGEWLIVFNDDVDISAISGFFSFSSEKNQRVAPKVRYATAKQAGYYRTSYITWSNRLDPEKQRKKVGDDSELRNIIMVSPNSPLPVADKWELQVLKGMPNGDGNASLAEDRSYQIGKVEDFKVASVNGQVSVGSPRRIALGFNRVLPETLPLDFVLVSPEVENLSIESLGKVLYLAGDLSEHDTYTVVLSKNIESIDGETLRNPGSSSVKFIRLTPELALPSEDEAQLAKGLRKYAISTVNLSEVQIRIKKLSGEGVVRTYQGYRNYTGRGPNWDSIENISALPYAMVPGETVFEKTIKTGISIDDGKTLELNWDDLLPADTGAAAVFIDVVGIPHPDAKETSRRNVQAIVQLTDIGLAWKFTDKSALLFAFSCDTGKPLPGVKISTYGEDAKLLTEVLTDESGLVKIPRGGNVRHLQANLGSDSYTVAFDKTIDQVGLWHFPVRYSWMKDLPEMRRAFLFTDRSVYRPGEVVRIKGIVRDQLGNEIAHSEKVPARVVILDPKEKEIVTQAVELSALGSFDFSFTLPEATTGDHVIRLEFPDDMKLAEGTEDWEMQSALQRSASFELPLKVEEFRRNAFEVLQSVGETEVGASEVTVDLTARYYQGQPVAAGQAKTFTEITSINPYPERYRDFLFGNHKVNDWRYWYNYFGYRNRDDDDNIARTSLSSDQVLSKDGLAEVSVSIPQSEFPTAQNVSIGTEVTDANNQTLTAKSSVVVHPASLYAGISRIDRLLRVGEEAPFRFVVTDTKGQPAKADTSLTVTLSREVHTTTKTKNEKGETITESEPSEEELSTVELVVTGEESAKEGFAYKITPEHDGLHFLTVKGRDPEGREFATVTRFHVYGASEYPWQYEDGLRIKLVSEQKSYKAGDTARILVLSPIEGTALVTVEREDVLSSYLTELKADNPVIEIPITDEHAPNAYVSILIVKGSSESGREIKAPQLRLGFCELTVENQRDRLAVVIDEPAESYRPGTEVELSGSVNSSDGKPAEGAEVTFYAVDEGTLSVMGYDTPDPMAFFYDPRKLSVDSGTSFHDFISEDPEMRYFHNKGFFIGGGGDLSKLAEMRKNFDPCAAWAPAIITDAEGKFTHQFKLPDTLTRYRVIAVAHHKGASFGHSESSIIAKKPLMLEPKLPRFANEGDELDTQVLVQNASDHTATWEISCSTGDGDKTPIASLTGTPSQTVRLAPDESATLVFPIRVNSTGAVTISFRATPLSLGKGDLTPDLKSSLSDAVEGTFEAEYPMPLLKQVTALRLTSGATTDMLELLSENLANATGKVELEIATSPLVEISSSVDYLLRYPYGCAEQTSSSMMPWLAVKNLRPFVPALSKKTDKEVTKAINAGVGRLLSMQQNDGSFGYWPGDTTTNDWVTPYAGMVLTLASRNGGSVPPSALESLSQYLIKSLRGAGEAKTSYELENYARSLYTLALLGKAQAPYHALMAEKLPFMSDSARALLAASIAISSEGRPKVLEFASQVLNTDVSYKPLENGGYWMPGNESGASRLIAELAINPDSDSAHKTLDKLLNDRNPYGHWRSTWMNGWGLLAISEYASHLSQEHAETKLVLETIDGEQRFSLTKDQPAQAISVDLTPGAVLKISSDTGAYVRMNVAAKPAIAPLAPVAKNGLSIDRFYEKVLASGQVEVLKKPSPGDLIRVTLRVTLPEDDSRYVVVDDPLPSIFETVNSDFASQSSAQGVRTSEQDWQISHSELRSERAVFFLDRVWKSGTYEITYLARCTIAGDAVAPPAKVESMYNPENFALSASQVFEARK